MPPNGWSTGICNLNLNRHERWFFIYILREVRSSLFDKSHSIDYKSIQHYKYKFIEYYRNGAILFKFEMKTTRNKNEWWCRKVITTGKYSPICKINFNNKRETLQVETAPHIPYHNFVTTKVPVHTWAREFDANASFSIFENKKAKVQGIWGKTNRNSAAPFTEQNVTPGRVRASLPSEFIEKSFQYVCMHTIFDTRVELLPVVELYL